MNKYIIQFKSIGDNWQDVWRVDTLAIARKYCKRCIEKGYKARVVKEL